MTRSGTPLMGAGGSLVAFRLAFGAASLLSPRPTWRLAGIDARRNPDAPLVARFFASRELMIGVGLALSSGTAERRRWLALGMVTDALDAATAVSSHRRGDLSAGYATLDAAGSVLALALGAAARSDLR